MERTGNSQRVGNAYAGAAAWWTAYASYFRAACLFVREQGLRREVSVTGRAERSGQVVQLRRRQALAASRRQERRAALARTNSGRAGRRRLCVFDPVAGHGVQSAAGRASGPANGASVFARDWSGSRFTKDFLSRRNEECRGAPD